MTQVNSRPDVTIAQVVEAYTRLGSKKAVGLELGIDEKSVRRRLMANTIPGVMPPPDGQIVKGVSTLYDAEGNAKLQWVKTRIEETERLQQITDAITEAFNEAPRVPNISGPKSGDADIMVVFPMGDPHIGLYSWAAETGADFDLRIAENNLVDATERLVATAPSANKAVIVNLGDFFHADNSTNRTLRSGHALDVDSRWNKVLRVGVRAMRACIDAALSKFPSVYVVNEIGNHDDHSSVMLTIALAMLYENNPRVEFDQSPAKYHYLPRFGKCLIGITHGDTCKPDALGGIMATDRAEDWGASMYRYWLTGHVHTQRVFEFRGVTAESFRTLAAPDAWSMGAGYRSGRDMQSIAYHKEFGEVERHRVDIRMLETT